MSSTIGNIRDKMRRRFSHKNAEDNTNFDEYESGDEETEQYVTKEVEEEEKTADETRPNYGRSGSLINRMILHGNKKTDEEEARDKAAYEARQNQITQPTDGVTAGKGNVVIR